MCQATMSISCTWRKLLQLKTPFFIVVVKSPSGHGKELITDNCKGSTYQVEECSLLCFVFSVEWMKYHMFNKQAST